MARLLALASLWPTLFVGNWSLADSSHDTGSPVSAFRFALAPSSNFTPNAPFEFYEAAAVFLNTLTFAPFKQNPYTFYGFRDLRSDTFFMLALQKSNAHDDAFRQINDCLLNYTNLSAEVRSIAEDLLIAPDRALAIGFFTRESHEPLTPYDIPLRFSGTLILGERDVELNGLAFDFLAFIFNGKVYGVLNAIYIVSSFYAWLSISSRQQPHFITSLSIHSFIIHASYEFGYGLFLLNIALNYISLHRVFLLCFLCILLLYVWFQMSTVAVIWRVSERVTELDPAALRCSLLRLFGSASFLMIASILAVALMNRFPLIPLLFLYSSFVPQIVHSARSGNRKSGDTQFVVTVTVNRLFVLTYLFLYRSNIIGTYAPITACVVAVYSLAQMAVILLQNRFGPSALLPASRRSPLFNYSRPIEAGVNCQICLSPIQPDEPSMLPPCGHAFHGECLMRWMQEEMICPVCTQRLPEPLHPEQYAQVG
jgi:hypothetical protein